MILGKKKTPNKFLPDNSPETVFEYAKSQLDRDELTLLLALCQIVKEQGEKGPYYVNVEDVVPYDTDKKLRSVDRIIEVARKLQSRTISYRHIEENFRKSECTTRFINGIRTSDADLTVEIAPTLLFRDYIFGKTEVETYNVFI